MKTELIRIFSISIIVISLVMIFCACEIVRTIEEAYVINIAGYEHERSEQLNMENKVFDDISYTAMIKGQIYYIDGASEVVINIEKQKISFGQLKGDLWLGQITGKLNKENIYIDLYMIRIGTGNLLGTELVDSYDKYPASIFEGYDDSNILQCFGYDYLRRD